MFLVSWGPQKQVKIPFRRNDFYWAMCSDDTLVKVC